MPAVLLLVLPVLPGPWCCCGRFASTTFPLSVREGGGFSAAPGGAASPPPPGSPYPGTESVLYAVSAELFSDGLKVQLDRD